MNMMGLLWLVPTLPIAGFLILALARGLSRRAAAAVGVGSIAASAVCAILIGIAYLRAAPEQVVVQVLWTWMNVGGLTIDVSLYLDALSLVMILVITFVAFLIHLYSISYMADDDGFSRFFAYMNLFVGSMLILVLAGNLLLLYVGWEGVGLCSYLLIGFWYKNPGNARAAMKAFIVTRIGDAAMAIGFFVLFWNLGTLDIQQVMQSAAGTWTAGSGIAVAAALLLLGGALGKSAQLPLQTWLPDAMAGPTPVSALIHAATMVIAGVYLIARTHVLFELAPSVMHLVAVIGAATLLLAGFSALAQKDIKRVLAYSTMSQIGYMFLALGVGAWSAGIFHFVTHAFFKALLFLGAGVIIVRMHEEHDMFKMGGLRKELPLTFWTFLIGCLALTALPPVTAGVASKDLILYKVWSSEWQAPALWTAGLVGAFVTSIYTFRMVFVTFFGETHRKPERKEGFAMGFPLAVLAFFTLFIGLLEWPRTLGDIPLFSHFLQPVLPDVSSDHEALKTEAVLEIAANLAALLGLLVAYVLYQRKRVVVERMVETGWGTALHQLLSHGWGFDRLYDAILVNPFVKLCRANSKDVVDSLYSAVAAVALSFSHSLRRTQTGRVRAYATAIVMGAIIIIGLAVIK
jgi:NADH-quinone oxidoreductase subunit L